MTVANITKIEVLRDRMQAMGLSFSGQGRFFKHSFGTTKTQFKTPIFEGYYFEPGIGNLRGLGSRQPNAIISHAGYINRQRVGLNFEAAELITDFLEHIYHG